MQNGFTGILNRTAKQGRLVLKMVYTVSLVTPASRAIWFMLEA